MSTSSGSSFYPALKNGLKTFFANGGGAFAALLVLVVICSATNPTFSKTDNLLNILRQCTYSGLIALGMTYVIVAGGIDLSVGSLFAFSGVATVELLNLFPADGSPIYLCLLAFALSVLIGGACGALNGALVVFGKLPPFIATLGTYSVFRSLALYMADSGNATPSSPELVVLLTDFGSSSLLGLPVPVWFLLSLAVLLGVHLASTPGGRHTLATGSNPRVARFAGIRISRVCFLTYLLVGLLAGLSAFLFLGRLGTISSSNAGMLYELDAIAAVIIGGASMNGGRGTIAGTLAGVLILGIVSNILDLWGVNVSLQGTVKGLVIILSVLIQHKRTRL